MTTQEYQALFDKLKADNDGKYISILNPGKQCFDVAVKFTDSLGVPHAPGNPSPFPYPNASQIYTDFGAFQGQYFDRIPNTPDYVPQKGDIVVWDKAVNGNIGHVAVATGEGDMNHFKSFDQNWQPGSVCKVVDHNYNFVLGALRYKGVITQPVPSPVDPTIQHKASIADRIVKARDGQQADPGKWTDAQEKDFIDRMLREKNRAVEFDRDVIAAFGDGADSNTKTSKEVVAKLKMPLDKEALKKAITTATNIVVDNYK